MLRRVALDPARLIKQHAHEWVRLSNVKRMTLPLLLASLVLISGLAQAAAAPSQKAVITFGNLLIGDHPGGITRVEDSVVAPDGSIYVVGETSPRLGPFDDPAGDIMVQKLDPDGRDVAWERYFDSQDADYANAVTLDAAGNVYVAGGTYEGNFPTTDGAFMTQGDCASALIKLTPDGELAFSTLVAESFGGSCPGPVDQDLVVDASGAAYMIGSTPQASCREGMHFIGEREADHFHVTMVVKISADGSERPWATCVKGDGDLNGGSAIALGSQGQILIAGSTNATDMPADGYQLDLGGTWDAYLATLSPDGSRLEHFTYLGGPNGDDAFELEPVAGGDVLVLGSFGSGGMASPGAAQAQKGGDQDALIARLSEDGRDLRYATYLGGESDDRGDGLAIDAGGRVFVAGVTGSKGFPVVHQFKSRLHGSDAFVATLEPDGSTFGYVSYLGGNDQEFATNIDLSGDGTAIVVGSSASNDLPLANPTIPDARTQLTGFIYFISELATRCDVLGTAGRDHLYGSPEGDRLCGGAERDRLTGRDGDDTLVGGPGKDRCLGGRGRDRKRSC